MANTYLLLIDQLYVQPVLDTSSEDETSELINVVTRVDYRYEATSEDGTIVNWHSTKNMGEPEQESFLEYNDVTYEIAQDWIRHSEEEETHIYMVLDNQITEKEVNRFQVPDKMPWEVLPPGEESAPANPDEN